MGQLFSVSGVIFMQEEQKKGLSRPEKQNFWMLLVAWLITCASTFAYSFFKADGEFTLEKWLFLVSAFFIFLVLLGSFYFYIRNYYKKIIYPSKNFGALLSILVISYVINLFASIFHMYAMPITLAALMATLFFDSKLAFITNAYMVLFVLVSASGSALLEGVLFNHDFLTMIIIAFVCGTILSFVLTKSSSRIYFIAASLAVNLLALPLMFMSELFRPDGMDYMINGLMFIPIQLVGATACALILQPIIESVFNLTSNFRLVELCDHNRPLLKRMAETAPGTFNHAQTVAGLAEVCASAIGENIYLARASAYYHDVGKLKNPLLFMENQATDENAHDELTPEASTDIIRRHVTNGIAICKEYRIPSEVALAAAEHHGTTVVSYFFHKAKELTDGRELNATDYSYLGPTPSTKISAIIMICDTCEAAVRSIEKPTSAQVDQTVQSIIKQRLDTGQFDNCPITMSELSVIRQVIVNAFCGLYHQRIKYPS
jgi:hypothetical protein